MSLVASVTEALNAAFAGAGDLITGVTYRKQALGEYDPALGSQPVTNTDRAVKAIEAELSAWEIREAGLSARAIKLYVRCWELAAAPAMEPLPGDKILHNGLSYTVKRAFYEGAPIIWEIWADV